MNLSPLNELPVFLAYSLALEEESAERLREMADIMGHHHQSDLEQLFLKLADFSDKHAAEVKEICGDQPLPDLKPWDFNWPGMEPPETYDFAEAHYQMTPRQALVNMLKMERNTAEFYRNIAQQSQNPDISLRAMEFANEETSHASALEAWIKRLPEDIVAPDIDPPTQPD